MSKFYYTINELASSVLEDVSGFSALDYEIIQVSINSSLLFQEIQILFSFELDKGMFRTNKQLREFKYDLSNKCGVMLQVSDKNDTNPKLLEFYGDEGIIKEKDWL